MLVFSRLSTPQSAALTAPLKGELIGGVGAPRSEFYPALRCVFR